MGLSLKAGNEHHSPTHLVPQPPRPVQSHDPAARTKRSGGPNRTQDAVKSRLTPAISLRASPGDSRLKASEAGPLSSFKLRSSVRGQSLVPEDPENGQNAQVSANCPFLRILAQSAILNVTGGALLDEHNHRIRANHRHNVFGIITDPEYGVLHHRWTAAHEGGVGTRHSRKNSFTARPPPAKLSSFISEYFRE